MREAGGLFLVLFGSAFIWIAVHGFEGTGLAGIMNSIFGGIAGI